MGSTEQRKQVVQWVFPGTNQFSNTSCVSVVQFNSDSNCLGLLSDAISQRAQFHKLSPFEMPDPGWRLSLADWLQVGGSKDSLFRFSGLLEWLRELRKAFYLQFQVYYTGYTSGQTDGRDA